MKRGFTLLETVIAMAILVIGIIGVVRLLPVGLGASKSSEMMSKGAFLAQDVLEQLKLAGFDELTKSEPEVALEGEQGDYSWTAELEEVSLAGVPPSENIRRLTLTLVWEEKGRPRRHDFVTYIRK